MSSIDILVPDLPESIVDATVATWHKKPGDKVKCDEVLVEIETDKVILEVPSLMDGILDTILKDEGSTVTSRQILGRIRKDNSSSSEEFTIIQPQQTSLENEINDEFQPVSHYLPDKKDFKISIDENASISSYLSCKDVKKKLEDSPMEKEETGIFQETSSLYTRSEKRVPMSRLRKCISERLLKTKSSTAMLTTFNEVNMEPIINLRKKYSEIFEKKHGIRLGFIPFYVKTVIEALKRYPKVNASIDDDDIVYHNYFDVSMAVSTSRGLVTPVLRNADTLSIADIDKKIKELSLKGRDGKLTIEDITGGNFTITNGGVFGSLMSTPIINPPQSAILGIHAIKDRPMAIDGKIKILPMMYLALSYDHRLIDGYESVNFLVVIKELLEDPIRLLLEI